MHRKHRKLHNQLTAIMGIVVIVAIILIALPVGATSGSAFVISISANCTPSSLVSISAAISAEGAGEHEVVRYLSNPERNSATASTTVWSEEPGIYTFTTSVPPDTQAGDYLVLIVAVTDSQGEVFGYQSIRYDCATGYLSPVPPPDFGTPAGEPGAAGTEGTATTEPTDGSGVSSPNVPTMNGQPACGIFALDGWGYKTVLVSDFPICTGYAPAVTIACLTATGTWTQEDVHNIAVAEDEVSLSFDVTQHGHCGIFPIGTVPAAQTSHQ